MKEKPMEAGPALDELIAEKVMGWAPVKINGRLVGWREPGQASRLNESMNLKAESTPKFSTDIAAAWKVIEKLVNESSGFSLVRDSFDGTWSVRFKGNDATAFASTAPHTTCLAALKAVGAS